MELLKLEELPKLTESLHNSKRNSKPRTRSDNKSQTDAIIDSGNLKPSEFIVILKVYGQDGHEKFATALGTLDLMDYMPDLTKTLCTLTKRADIGPGSHQTENNSGGDNVKVLACTREYEGLQITKKLVAWLI